MSDDHSSESSVNSFINALTLIGLPLVLILMLGFTGVAFVRGMGPGGNVAEAEDGGTAVAAAAAGSGDIAGVPAPVATTGGSGGETPAPEGIDPAQWAVGRKAYATCAACHGADGKGLKAGAALMAPSLIGSETLLGNPDQPILVVLKGIKKETNDYLGAMAALGALPDDQIAGVLTYLRNNWGNEASAITTEQVAAARERFSSVNEPAGIPRARIPEILGAPQ